MTGIWFCWDGQTPTAEVGWDGLTLEGPPEKMDSLYRRLVALDNRAAALAESLRETAESIQETALKTWRRLDMLPEEPPAERIRASGAKEGT